jgi:hypothetical protein
VRNKDEILRLAEQYGVKTNRRHFIDKRGPNGALVSTFIDLPRPIDDIRDELVALGAIR